MGGGSLTYAECFALDWNLKGIASGPMRSFASVAKAAVRPAYHASSTVRRRRALARDNITKRVFVSVLCMQGADMHEHACAVGMCCKGTSLGAALAQRNMHHAVQVLVGGGLGWRADSSQAP